MAKFIRQNSGFWQERLKNKGMAIAIDRLELKQSIPESALISQAKAGNKDAIGVLWSNYRLAFRSIASRMSFGPEDADDFAQEMGIRMPGIIQRHDPEKGQFSTLVTSSAVHLGIDSLRSRRARPVSFGLLPDHKEVEEWAFVDEDADPQQQTTRRERQRLLRQALTTLPVNQRQALEFVGDGYTQTEIAQMTGSPLGTVKSRIRLGEQKVRDWLLENGQDHFGDEHK